MSVVTQSSSLGILRIHMENIYKMYTLLTRVSLNWFISVNIKLIFYC
jgi:hypothetical protein